MSRAEILSHWWKVVPLTEEIEELNQLGDAREHASRQAGLKTMSAYQSAEIHRAGVQGEWAVSLVIRRDFRKTAIASASEMRLGDMDGSIEVKASRGAKSFQWDLIESDYRLKESSIYVHTITAFWPECVWVTGWCTGEELKRNGQRKRGAVGQPITVLPVFQLRDIKTIFDHLR